MDTQRKDILFVAVIISFCMHNAVCATPTPNFIGDQTSPTRPTYRIEQNCSPQDSLNVKLPGLTLQADSGSVIESFALSAERLPSTEAVAPMPSGMVNVTSGRAVYRLLLQG